MLYRVSRFMDTEVEAEDREEALEMAMDILLEEADIELCNED